MSDKERVTADKIGEGFDGTCPVCCACSFTIRIDRLRKPGYPKYIAKCMRCGESGDFLDVNDYIYDSINRLRALESELKEAREQRDKLADALLEADWDICGLCKRVNQQQKDCVCCLEHEDRTKVCLERTSHD